VITSEQATGVAVDWICDQWSPDWEPAIVRVEDADASWRVFYNSRVYLETKSVSHALAGNLPLLVSKATGTVTIDAAYPSE